MADSRPGLLARVASAALGLVAARADAQPPAGAAERTDAPIGPWPAGLVDRTDCGLAPCGPGGSGDNLLRWATPAYIGLDRDTIDILSTDELMEKIISKIVIDMLGKGRPKLTGETLGELSDVTDSLWKQSAREELQAAAIYARRYGGAGILTFVSDGRPAHQPVDPSGNWAIEAMYALPKWYLTPNGIGSPRTGAAWYGPRTGRPEHYIVSPDNAVGDMPQDLGPMLRRSGNVFHRSRVVPFHFRPTLDFRQARRWPNWGGWGPGIVEAVAKPYLIRQAGIARTDDIMNSVVMNVLTMPGVLSAVTTPTGGGALRKVLEFVKACRDWTAGQGIPLVAIDSQSKLESLSHTLAGIADLIKAQRQNLLDHAGDYPEVVLFGTSSSGLSGDGKEGEWRAYYQGAETLRDTWIWTDGSFGGGLRQLCLLAMMSKRGPTRGQVDYAISAEWPKLWAESNDQRSAARLRDSQARALDRANLGLTEQAMIRHDPTVQAAYPSLDVDEEPLPTLEEGALEEAPVSAGESALTVGQATKQTTGEAEAGTDAARPRPRLVASPGDATPPSPLAPVPAREFPGDLVTFKQAQRLLKCGPAPIMRLIRAGKLDEHRLPVGNRGAVSRRVSLAQLLAAVTAPPEPAAAAQ